MPRKKLAEEIKKAIESKTMYLVELKYSGSTTTVGVFSPLSKEALEKAKEKFPDAELAAISGMVSKIIA